LVRDAGKLLYTESFFFTTLIPQKPIHYSGSTQTANYTSEMGVSPAMVPGCLLLN